MKNKMYIVKYDKIKKEYEKSCNKIVELFCEKQDLKFDYWIGDKVGGIADCGSFDFYLEDIILDLDKDLKKGFIFDWYDDNLDYKQYINYNSYIMGLRHENLK